MYNAPTRMSTITVVAAFALMSMALCMPPSVAPLLRAAIERRKIQGTLGLSRRATHAVNITECKPMPNYAAAEMSAWLATQEFTLDPVMGGIIDGESLIGFVDSPKALSETSILLKLFPVHEIAKVVHQVRNSKIEPMTELPPVLDKCSRLFQQDAPSWRQVRLSRRYSSSMLSRFACAFGPMRKNLRSSVAKGQRILRSRLRTRSASHTQFCVFGASCTFR